MIGINFHKRIKKIEEVTRKMKTIGCNIMLESPSAFLRDRRPYVAGVLLLLQYEYRCNEADSRARCNHSRPRLSIGFSEETVAAVQGTGFFAAQRKLSASPVPPEPLYQAFCG